MSDQVNRVKRSKAAAALEDQPLDVDVRDAVIPLCGFEWRGDCEPEADGRSARLIVRRDSASWENVAKEPDHKWLQREDNRLSSAPVRRVAFSSLPGIFSAFIQLEPTEEGFLGFANQYGLLGLRSSNFLAGRYWGAELFRHWEAEHRLLKETVASMRHSVNKRTRLKKEWQVNDELRTYSRCELIWSERRKRYTLKAYPVTLLGVMWWQVARMLTGEVTYERCEQCDRLIERGPDSHIASKRFCSPACNQKHHRARVKEAKALKASGLSVSMIAKQLDTTPDAIKHWLTKTK